MIPIIIRLVLIWYGFRYPKLVAFYVRKFVQMFQSNSNIICVPAMILLFWNVLEGLFQGILLFGENHPEQNCRTFIPLVFPTATTRVAKQAGEKKNYILVFFEITRNLPTVNWKKTTRVERWKSLPPNRKRGTSRPQPWAVLCSGVPSPGAIEDMCFWSYCQTRPRSHPRKKTEFRNKSLPKCSMYGIVVYI